MLLTIRKNISVVTICKAILIFALLFSSLLSTAQEDEKIEAIVADTTGIKPPPPEEETEADVNDGDNKYFYKRSDTLSVEQRSISGAAVKKMKEDEDFWYANAEIKKKKSQQQVEYEREQGQKGQKGKNEPPIKEHKVKEQQQTETYEPIGQRSWFQTVLWIVILAIFVIGLAFYLRGNSVGLFRKKNVKLGNAGEDEITEDIFAINYQKEIDKAAAQGNYRLAIRLMFLRTLKNMAEKNIISYKQDKTNLDYLLELHPTNYYNNFFRITRNYEYSWYGQFNVSEGAYKTIRSDFDQFDSTLK